MKNWQALGLLFLLFLAAQLAYYLITPGVL